MRRLLQSRCEGYLAYLLNPSESVTSLQDIPVVCRFPDVFSEELSGMPPVLEIDFFVELVPGTAPISRAPYRMCEVRDLRVLFCMCFNACLFLVFGTIHRTLFIDTIHRRAAR